MAKEKRHLIVTQKSERQKREVKEHKVKDVEAITNLAETALLKPLEYEVIHTTWVSIRERPDPQSRELGRLTKGMVAAGFPGGGWLRLLRTSPLDLGHQHGWVFIGTRLAAMCMRITVQETCSHGLSVVWPGVPASRVAYSVEWRPTSGEFSGDYVVTREPHADLYDLPLGATLNLRVHACLFCASPDSVGTSVRVSGPWSEGTAVTVVREEEGAGPVAGSDPVASYSPSEEELEVLAQSQTELKAVFGKIRQLVDKGFSATDIVDAADLLQESSVLQEWCTASVSRQ